MGDQTCIRSRYKWNAMHPSYEKKSIRMMATQIMQATYGL